MINGNRLRELRKNNKLKQSDVAEKLNIERTTYVRYENEEINPPSDMVLAIAKIFDVSTDYILGNTDNPLPQGQLPPKPTIENVILSDNDLSEESRKDLLKQYELLKLRDELKKRNEEATESLRPKLT